MGVEGCATKTLRGWHTSHCCFAGVGASHEDDRSLREGLAAPDLGGQQQQLVSALSMRGCELCRTTTDCGTAPSVDRLAGSEDDSRRRGLTLTIPVGESPPPNGPRPPTGRADRRHPLRSETPAPPQPRADIAPPRFQAEALTGLVGALAGLVGALAGLVGALADMGVVVPGSDDAGYVTAREVTLPSRFSTRSRA